MIEAGVHLGLPRATATELVVQTVVGSAKLLRETGEHPTVLRERVTSPAGTTAAAIRRLEEGKVRADFLAAIEAAGTDRGPWPPPTNEYGAASESAGIDPAGRAGGLGGRPRPQAARPRDAPAAFESTYEGEQGRSEEEWRAWLTRPTG